MEKIEKLEHKFLSIWDNINNISNSEEMQQDIDAFLELLDSGIIRVLEKKSDGSFFLNEWVKKGIMIALRFLDSKLIPETTTNYYDKIKSKFSDWTIEKFAEAQIRAVPGSRVRYGSFIDQKVIIMPSFINLGSYINSGTMIDTWATIGSCAYIGRNCHISGGTGIGGVLEPINAKPVIINDNCFIGARSEIAEGVEIGEGSVISMGVFIGASTKIINRVTGEILYGKVPPYSVIVPGSVMDKYNNINLSAAIIIKQVDENTRKKTSLNDLLRY